ncbi:unnamed protein product [Arctia plantaginis]|uniref:Uncharacterized protein n=1 Tax=Arctia plantaginis TaxID=874455 RepID=A0A8S0YYE0_ARCPL|nr:unnamed protein product [Arctia plantaginis]
MLQPSDLSTVHRETKKKLGRTMPYKRPQSLSPVTGRLKTSPTRAEVRSKSLTGTGMQGQKPSLDHSNGNEAVSPSRLMGQDEEKNTVIPQCMLTKMSRILAIKKREFLKLRKSLIAQQSTVLENYANLKELENRLSVSPEDSVGNLQVVSMKGWPAHDILLLVRDDVDALRNLEINSLIGSHVLQQFSSRLNPIPDEVLAVCAEISARRLELLDMLRCKHRLDRPNYCTNLDWKTKNMAFDTETEKLHKMVNELTENIKAKVLTAFELAKIPWVDRDSIIKKVERAQKENLILQSKLDELAKNNKSTEKGSAIPVPDPQSVCEELSKERAANEALKEVVASAETMLRVARARIATLERQLKDSRTELEGARKRHKELEHLYRTRESSYDARSRKLMEVSKTGEITIETLSRQRDALEMRVKELREQAAIAEQAVKAREAQLQARFEALQAKATEQERCRNEADARVAELEAKLKETEAALQDLQEHAAILTDMDRKRCLDYLPTKENEPSEKKRSYGKSFNFLNSLARIAQGEGQGEGSENLQEKIAIELLDKEQQIVKLKRAVDEHEENQKSMEESMTQYENQLAALRLEVRRLRNYDCFAKEVKYEDLETELLELNMQISTLNRERSELVSATASRALMLERYERSTELFANMIRMRRDLRALIDGRTTPPVMDETYKSEVSRSISSVCVNAADTWTALRAERVRVMRLEAALLTQRLQLERQGQVRTLLERRRAMFERIASETNQNNSTVA